jgi:hypothetical protein
MPNFDFLDEEGDESSERSPPTAEVMEFIRCYSTDVGESRIRFDWNGKHSEGFVDRNMEFRGEVLQAVLRDVVAAPIDLIRDLFRAETKCSREAWGIVDGVGQLAEQLLRRGGPTYLDDYLEGKFQSFDAHLGSAFEYDLPLAKSMLSAVQGLARAEPKSSRAALRQKGEELFSAWVADCEKRTST